MNKVILMGRLVKDPDVRYSQGHEPMAIARYTLAVDRAIKKDREQTADFIGCVAFGKNGEFAEKYLHKGTKIAVEGRIQTGSYTDKDGRKVYTTDVVIEHHEFCESRSNGGNSGSNNAPDADGFVGIADGVDDEALPFN
jgi:single-strand DNA-binding protein